MAERAKHTLTQPQKKQQREKSRERRRQIAAVLLAVSGLIALLSILSYSTADEHLLDRLGGFDVVRALYNADVKAQMAQLHNKLGFIGSLLANFFVVSTIGYFSVLFPLLMMLWGWVLLFRRDTARPVTLTNYALLLGLLAATIFGVSNIVVGSLGKEWCGAMGGFLGDLLVRLLGAVGASIIIVVAFLVAVVMAVDLDIHATARRVAAWWAFLREQAAAMRSRESGATGTAPRGPVTITPQAEEDVSEDAETAEGSSFDEEPEDDAPDEEAEPEEPAQEPRPLPIVKTPAVDGLEEPPDAPPPALEEEQEIDYAFPSVDLLDTPRQSDAIPDEELKANAELVRAKLAHFGVEIESVSVTPGPVITLYELVPASGVKISKIVSLADDLALALAAKGIRIMAPIPGKSAVGVEIPNRNPSMVYLRSVLNAAKFREAKAYLPIALGKNIAGEVAADDLSRMPHLLIAGSTGSGKSVGINTILASLLFRLHPSEVKFVIIDPKKIELTNYAKLKHHFLAISPDIGEEIVTTPENAVNVLKSVELEMEKRYDRLAAAGVRNIQDYNGRLALGKLKNTDTVVHRKMPFLIVVIDELADLMMTAAREVEGPIARLAQLARAVGIHLVLATQRPSVDVITGVIKANFPARIAYQVASKTDSRTILDMNGAEQLLGSGDMLYLPSGSPKPMRIQNAFISSDEVERLTEYIARQQGYARPFTLPSVLERKRAGSRGAGEGRDELFEEAARTIVQYQQGSVSLLQRKLKVGYSRAARIVDELESAGVVGPFDGSKAREVLIDDERRLEELLSRL